MSNTAAIAEHWTRFIAGRPEFPAGAQLLAQFKAGSICKLCHCGCNSYEFDPTSELGVPLLAAPNGKYGAIFEVSFQTKGGAGSIELAVFADGLGRLAGIEVDHCANSSPVPEGVQLQESPYHVHVSEGAGA